MSVSEGSKGGGGGGGEPKKTGMMNMAKSALSRMKTQPMGKSAGCLPVSPVSSFGLQPIEAGASPSPPLEVMQLGSLFFSNSTPNSPASSPGTNRAVSATVSELSCPVIEISMSTTATSTVVDKGCSSTRAVRTRIQEKGSPTNNNNNNNATPSSPTMQSPATTRTNEKRNSGNKPTLFFIPPIGSNTQEKAFARDRIDSISMLQQAIKSRKEEAVKDKENLSNVSELNIKHNEIEQFLNDLEQIENAAVVKRRSMREAKRELNLVPSAPKSPKGPKNAPQKPPRTEKIAETKWSVQNPTNRTNRVILMRRAQSVQLFTAKQLEERNLKGSQELQTPTEIDVIQRQTLQETKDKTISSVIPDTQGSLDSPNVEDEKQASKEEEEEEQTKTPHHTQETSDKAEQDKEKLLPSEAATPPKTEQEEQLSPLVDEDLEPKEKQTNKKSRDSKNFEVPIVRVGRQSFVSPFNPFQAKQKVDGPVPIPVLIKKTSVQDNEDSKSDSSDRDKGDDDDDDDDGDDDDGDDGDDDDDDDEYDESDDEDSEADYESNTDTEDSDEGAPKPVQLEAMLSSSTLPLNDGKQKELVTPPISITEPTTEQQDGNCKPTGQQGQEQEQPPPQTQEQQEQEQSQQEPPVLQSDRLDVATKVSEFTVKKQGSWVEPNKRATRVGWSIGKQRNSTIFAPSLLTDPSGNADKDNRLKSERRKSARKTVNRQSIRPGGANLLELSKTEIKRNIRSSVKLSGSKTVSPRKSNEQDTKKIVSPLFPANTLQQSSTPSALALTLNAPIQKIEKSKTMLLPVSKSKSPRALIVSEIQHKKDIVVVTPWGKGPKMDIRPISEMDLPKSQKMILLRAKCIEELISTERDYVNDLLLTSKIFYLPLKERRILKSKEIEILFSNMTMLLGVNSELLKELERDLEDSQGGHIGATFCWMSDFLKLYSFYCNNQMQAFALMEYLMKTNVRFSNFLKEQLNDPACRGLPLNGFLIKPTQRIMKYPLFLGQLVKFTEPDHADFENLTKSIGVMEDILTIINENRRRNENRTKLIELQSQFGRTPVVTFDLTYIMEDSVKELVSTTNSHLNELKKHHYVLLRECLIRAGLRRRYRPDLPGTMAQKKLQLIDKIPIADITDLRDIPDDPSNNIKNAFQISYKKNSEIVELISLATSPEKKKQWILNLSSLKADRTQSPSNSTIAKE